MGRTWTSQTQWMPQARLLQSTEIIILMPIKQSETIITTPIKRKANLEEDLLAGGTEDCGCPRLDGYKVQKP